MVSLRMIRKRTIKLDRRILEDMQQVGVKINVRFVMQLYSHHKTHIRINYVGP